MWKIYIVIFTSKEARDKWLDPDLKDTLELKDMLIPYPSNEMEAYEISPLILQLQKSYWYDVCLSLTHLNCIQKTHLDNTRM